MDQQTKSQKASLQTIVDNDLCVGCGACVHACQEGRIRLQFNETKGMYEPSAQQADHLASCDAADVCPSNEMDYSELASWIFGSAPRSEVGNVEKVYLAQSTDEARNRLASSGGLIKETLRYLLESKKISGVIALNRKEGLTYEPEYITEFDKIDTLPGSIYHNVDFEDAITLLKKAEGKVALVAIPCQFEGLYQYIRTREPQLKEKLFLTIGLFCGWTYSYHALKAICAYCGVTFEDLVDVSYRGGGPVGKLRLTTKDGSQKAISRRTSFKYQAAFDRSFNLKRCHYCVNHTNYLADLVVGDAWLPSTVFTKSGISLVIARTPNAKSVVEDLAGSGAIKQIEVSEAEVVESQKPRVIYGNFSYPYAEFTRKSGRFAPKLTGPNNKKTQPVREESLEAFDWLFCEKVSLQRRGAYKKLLRMKFTKEFRKLSARYIEWFLVRILKIKSLKGERKEIPKERLEIFR